MSIQFLGSSGQGYKAVEEGWTCLEGPMPINTSGGLKCKGHPVGATGVSRIYEVWKQCFTISDPMIRCLWLFSLFMIRKKVIDTYLAA